MFLEADETLDTEYFKIEQKRSKYGYYDDEDYGFEGDYGDYDEEEEEEEEE